MKQFSSHSISCDHQIVLILLKVIEFRTFAKKKVLGNLQNYPGKHNWRRCSWRQFRNCVHSQLENCRDLTRYGRKLILLLHSCVFHVIVYIQRNKSKSSFFIGCFLSGINGIPELSLRGYCIFFFYKLFRTFL